MWKLGKSYGHCCLSYHQGNAPPNALFLMRLAIQLYSLSEVDYILKTTHAENPQAHLPIKFQKEQILKFCQCTSLNGLEILHVQEGDPLVL